MSATEEFIQHLEKLKDGERSRLRRLAGRPLDDSLPGFDLFTGLWWPLREKSPAAPRRETSWLVAKLWGAFPIPHLREAAACLPAVLGRCEPRDEHERRRSRNRFDALLQSPQSALEPHLRWALAVAAEAVAAGRARGVDWADLLDDLSTWNRSVGHEPKRDVRETWAEQYLNARQPNQRGN